MCPVRFVTYVSGRSVPHNFLPVIDISGQSVLKLSYLQFPCGCCVVRF